MDKGSITVTSARPGVAAGTIEMTLSTGDTWRVDDAGAREPPLVRRLHGGTFRLVGRLMGGTPSSAATVCSDEHVYIDPKAVLEDIAPAQIVAGVLIVCWRAWRAVDEALLALASTLESAGFGFLASEVLEDGAVALEGLANTLDPDGEYVRSADQRSISQRSALPRARARVDAAVAAARAAGYRVGS